jgi:hypothetical protein
MNNNRALILYGFFWSHVNKRLSICDCSPFPSSLCFWGFLFISLICGIRWDWVYFARRSLVGLSVSATDDIWVWSSRWNENLMWKPKYSEKSFRQCQFVQKEIRHECESNWATAMRTWRLTASDMTRPTLRISAQHPCEAYPLFLSFTPFVTVWTEKF